MTNAIPRLVVLELTRRCVLNCIHCRASAQPDSYNDELDTASWFKVLDDISSFSRPIIILSGGESLLREDVFDIISYARKRGLDCVIATCGMTVTEERVVALKRSGISAVGVSIDGEDAKTHDSIRRAKGVFDAAIKTTRLLKKHGIEFQINAFIGRYNFRQLDNILRLATELGASSFHPFFLVPVGRADELKDKQLTPLEYEEVLTKIYNLSLGAAIHCRPTCAPHYSRIVRKNAGKEGGPDMDALTSGCMGGKSFAFISSIGKVQTCGFLEAECGDIRSSDFSQIWQDSIVFNDLRDLSGYNGKCGVCEYLKVCGGCRARAYAATGDYLGEEPECVYQPQTVRS